MKGEAMSSLYLPPPEHLEYLVDRRPAKQAATPAEPAWPRVGIASDAEGPRVPRLRRWIVLG